VCALAPLGTARAPHVVPRCRRPDVCSFAHPLRGLCLDPWHTVGGVVCWPTAGQRMTFSRQFTSLSTSRLSPPLGRLCIDTCSWVWASSGASSVSCAYRGTISLPVRIVRLVQWSRVPPSSRAVSSQVRGELVTLSLSLHLVLRHCPFHAPLAQFVWLGLPLRRRELSSPCSARPGRSELGSCLSSGAGHIS